MTKFRNLAIAALSGIFLALGANVTFAQSVNSDNTSAGESGHGTGCSNQSISGGAGATNCRANTEHGINRVETQAQDPSSTAEGSGASFIPAGSNADNTSPGESGHGTGCSNPSNRTSGGVNGDTNCRVGSGSN